MITQISSFWLMQNIYTQNYAACNNRPRNNHHKNFTGMIYELSICEN